MVRRDFVDILLFQDLRLLDRDAARQAHLLFQARHVTHCNCNAQGEAAPQ